MRTQPVMFNLRQNTQAFDEAITFAYAQAFRWYQCQPSDMPERIFAACLLGQVVATVGVTHHHPEQPLPILDLYNFDETQLPKNWHWESVVQLSWFFSNTKDCFMNLLLMTLQYAHRVGQCYGILQMKDVVSSILKEKGLQLSPIDSAQLCMDKISEADRAYYQETSPVRLYYLAIIENIHSIEKYLLRMNAKTCHKKNNTSRTVQEID